MQEIYDDKTGAILFKSNQKIPVEKRVKDLEKEVFKLKIELNKIKEHLGIL